MEVTAPLVRDDPALRFGAEGGEAFRGAHFRFAVFHVAMTAFLLLAGGLVTSRDAGLAVPDWPTSFGNWWFVEMKGGVFFEHGHRIIAQLVGLLTIVHAAWLWRSDARIWMKKLGAFLVVAVIVQGVLGGITVIFGLPAPVSIVHGTLAQLFLCGSIAAAYFLSREWTAGAAPASRGVRIVQRLCWGMFAVVLAQLVIGATVRHSGASLAIPTFPLAFGHVIPPLDDPKVALHFTHRAFAVVVVLMMMVLVGRVMGGKGLSTRAARRMAGPAAALAILVFLQIALGAFAVWTATRWDYATLHQFNGAMILATTALLVLRSYRLPEATPEATT